MAESGRERALEAVADRTPVDWEALEREAGTAVDRDWLHWVRVLEGVAGLHEADDAQVPADRSVTLGPDESAPLDETSSGWGKYVLVEKVGEGGFGSVYRAWDPDLQLEVAIKILHRRIADARLKQALLQEGRALARIRHENVVRVLGVEAHDDQIALRMEFVRGETLEQVLHRQGTLNAREAALVGADICRALAAVHLEGFVHRDVKARNVMREKAGRIVLMDFGAGRQAEDLKIPGKIPNVGTPLYMAPEVMAGAPATPASDVYALGVLLYHLVTGKYPVEGETPEDIRLAHMAGRRVSITDRRPDISIDFGQVVERALAPDVSKRYASAGALLEALATIFGTLKEPDTTTAKQRAWTVVMTIGGAATLAIGLGLVNSLEFNSALGRAEYASENVLDWAWWGLRSSIGTLFTLLLVTFAFPLGLSLYRIALATSGTVRHIDGTLKAFALRVGHGLHLDEPQLRGSLLLLTSAGLLVGAWIYFQPLLGDLLLNGNVSAAPAEKLQLLSPANRPYHYLYRKTFTGVMIFAGVAWYLVWRFGATPRDLSHRILLAGVAAVFLLAMFSLDLPFRILYNADFQAVSWKNNTCYVIGKGVDDDLLFCPQLNPRNGRARWNNPAHPVEGGYEDLNRTENIFTTFDGTVEASGAPIR